MLGVVGVDSVSNFFGRLTLHLMPLYWNRLTSHDETLYFTEKLDEDHLQKMLFLKN